MNPFKPNGSSHPYQMDKSISVLRAVGGIFLKEPVGWYFFILIRILIEHSAIKTVENLNRPLDLRRLVHGSALFADVPM